MHDLNVALAAIGGMILMLGLLSGLIKKRWFLSEPLIAFLVGILLGLAVSSLLDLSRYGNDHAILEKAARLTMAVALRETDHKEEWGSALWSSSPRSSLMA